MAFRIPTKPTIACPTSTQTLYNPADAPTFVPGSNYNAISPTSPGLGTSPNPALAGTVFYLNGIGIEGQNGIPKGMVKNYWTDFGPRLGFAYDISGNHKTVVRGGFGIMYERIQGNDMYNGGPNQPFSTSVTFNNVSISNPGAALNTGTAYTNPITVGSITGLGLYRLQSAGQLSIQHWCRAGIGEEYRSFRFLCRQPKSSSKR